MNLSPIPALGVAALLLVPWAAAVEPYGGAAEPCPAAMNVTARKPIVVVLHEGLGKPVKGLYLRSDADSVTVETVQTGETINIEWSSIRKIKPKNSRSGFWAGLFAGAAIGAASALGGDEPSGAPLAAGFAAVGAAVGAVTARLADRPICEQPTGEQTSRSPSELPIQ